MRNIFKFLSLAAGASFLLSVSSCKEDFLEVEYSDILPTDMMTANDEGAEAGLAGCYKMMLPSDYATEWGLKPNLFFGCHPTLDTQATGWDVDWCKQNWGPDSEPLGQAWNHVYNAISRCNDFIREMNDAGCSESTKTQVIAEAKALRGFFYHWLAQSFGRVPVLKDDETYISAPTKARATDAEMWDAIIDDLKSASEVLDWKPRNGQYGRCTKGMALTYLADAYMWKAYRCKQPELYATARDIFKQIIESGTYALEHAYTTLFEPVNNNWNKETIWAEILDERDSFEGNQYGSFMHLKWFTGCKQTGGWGTLFLSWEWYLCYEQGDRRRDASACTGPVEQLKTDFPEAVSEYCFGQNPFVFDTIPTLQDPTKPAKYVNPETGKEVDNTSFAYHYQYKEESGWAPSVWTLKYWREPLSWSCNQPHCPIYYMRYANVLLLYAECCFRTNQESEGWDAINTLRNRAWGNLEADVDYTKYASYYATKYGQNNDPKSGFGADRIDRAAALMKDNYPIPFQKTTVEVPDAKTYYTQLKSDKGFKSDVWVVAVGTEYRKEFNAEWCLAPAMIRLDFLEDHLNVNYPKNQNPNGDADNWHTQRNYDFNPARVLMPIPADELKRNPECDQNEAYR